MLSFIDLKLDGSLMFVWQNHTEDQKEVPSYTKLLEFNELGTRALGNIAREGDWKCDSTKNLRSNHMWLKFRIVAWHAKQNINYIAVEIFAPCHIIRKWLLLRRMFFA